MIYLLIFLLFWSPVLYNHINYRIDIMVIYLLFTFILLYRPKFKAVEYRLISFIVLFSTISFTIILLRPIFLDTSINLSFFVGHLRFLLIFLMGIIFSRFFNFNSSQVRFFILNALLFNLFIFFPLFDLTELNNHLRDFFGVGFRQISIRPYGLYTSLHEAVIANILFIFVTLHFSNLFYFSKSIVAFFVICMICTTSSLSVLLLSIMLFLNKRITLLQKFIVTIVFILSASYFLDSRVVDTFMEIFSAIFGNDILPETYYSDSFSGRLELIHFLFNMRFDILLLGSNKYYNDIIFVGDSFVISNIIQSGLILSILFFIGLWFSIKKSYNSKYLLNINVTMLFLIIIFSSFTTSFFDGRSYTILFLLILFSNQYVIAKIKADKND